MLLYLQKKRDEYKSKRNYIGKFNDKRLDKRANLLSASFYHGRASSIHGVTFQKRNKKELTVSYRMKKVEERAWLWMPPLKPH